MSARCESLDEFVVAEGQNLLTFAFLVCRDEELAQDLVQAVLAKLVTKDWASLDAPLSYTRRAVVNGYRSHLRHANVFSRIAPRLADSTYVAEPADNVTSHVVLWELFDQLSARQRSALVLRYYEGLDDEDIARCLGCAPGTVRSLISRALRALKPHLTLE